MALVPPLATVGIRFGIGRTDLATGALLLFATNWLAIVLAAGIVFALVGFGAQRDAWGPFKGSLAGVVLVVVLAVLAVPLGINAIERWGDSHKNRVAAEAVREWDPSVVIERLVVDTTVRPTGANLEVSGGSAPESMDALAQLLAQGVHPRVVIETLGHSQIALMLNTYFQVIPALGREAADWMDDVLTTPSVG